MDSENRYKIKGDKGKKGRKQESDTCYSSRHIRIQETIVSKGNSKNTNDKNGKSKNMNLPNGKL